jgi:hypothetical protein
MLNLLPFQMVDASTLKRGDIAFINQWWQIVEQCRKRADNFNNGWNQEIITGRGGGYLPPDHKVRIIRRDLLDSNESEKLLSEIDKEKKFFENARKEERRLEQRRIKEQIRHLERELDDDLDDDLSDDDEDEG